MSSPYPILDDRPIDQWRVTELRDELKRRKLTTKGLKEELVKRLNSILFSELDTNEHGDNGYDNLPKSDIQFEEDERTSEIINDVVASQSEGLSEERKSESLASSTVEAGKKSGTDTMQMVYINSRKEDEGKIGSLVDGKDAKGNGVGYVSKEDEQSAEIFIQELPDDKEDMTSQPDLNHDKSELDKPQSPHADDCDLRSAHHTSSTMSLDPDKQAPEISLAIGVQVKSSFSSTESGSITEKNEVKDNVITDVTVQIDVKPDMIKLSSSTAHLACMESDHVDVHEKKDGDSAKIVGCIKNDNSVDTGSPEKLSLDRSSGDDSMEEDVPESKHDSDSDVLGPKVETTGPSLGREDSNIADAVDMSLDTKLSEMEHEKSSTAVSSKRKLHDQSTVENKDITKRQRRMQPNAFNLPREQSINTVAFTKRNDSMHPTIKGGFSKLKSADSEAPKEQVVSPSAKAPTTSLRIDRFLRPFTLKAVQDLLGRTGTIVSFWMDNIKTHCFVTYTSVEEAIETRNAVYNLQWPTNGGHLLIADFVDPREVRARVEGPLQSSLPPTTPAGLRPCFPSAQPAGPPQPSLRQQVQHQQLPPPLANRPAAREKVLQTSKQLAPVKEQLVKEQLPMPPPPVSEKVDPPALTLDDIFRKTTIAPRIYYLPLSDEQVAAKLKAQGISIQQ